MFAWAFNTTTPSGLPWQTIPEGSTDTPDLGHQLQVTRANQGIGKKGCKKYGTVKKSEMTNIKQCKKNDLTNLQI